MKTVIYVVAAGYAFTSKRGMLEEGDEVFEKDFASKEAFNKAIAKGKIIDSKDKAQASAAAEKAKAQLAVNTANEKVEAAKEQLDQENSNRADAEAKIAPAREALSAKENENGDIKAARKALTDLENDLAKAKPEHKAAIEEKIAKAKAVLTEKHAAVPEIKALADALLAAETLLNKVENDKKAAEDALKIAEKELETANAELKKLGE